MPVEAYEYRIQEIRRKIKELDSVMTDDVNKFEKILQEQVRLTIEGEGPPHRQESNLRSLCPHRPANACRYGAGEGFMAIRRRNGTIGGCSGQRVSRTQR